MRSVWSRLFLVAAFLLVSVGASPATAQSEPDLRGTWVLRFSDDTAESPVKSIVIKRQDENGAISGRYLVAKTVWRLAGKVKGSAVFFTIEYLGGPPPGRYRFEGAVRETGGRLQMRGTAENLVVTDPKDRFTAEQRLEGSPQGGTRASAALVVCDRDMTANTDDAVLECTAQVTDASAQPGSTAPTGSVTWATTKGAIAPATCALVPGGGSTSWCAVTLRARAGEIPIGTAPPVTAAYPGDAQYAPSEGSPQLYGAATGYSESDTYGPGCNPASVPQPTVGCGDPVNPATGNLVMTSVDLALQGRGPGLAIERTYNSLAAAAGATGRFGAGWSDAYGARIVIGPKKAATVHLGSGATVPFTAKGTRFTAPGWVTASLTRGPGSSYVLTLADQRSMTFDRSGRLVAISDRSGEPVSLAYAADGTVTTATDASGRAITFTSDAEGRVIGVTDPAGRAVHYAYDAAGDLVQVTDVAGGTTRFAYDGAHRLTSWTDATGATISNRYDPQHRVMEQVDPLGGMISFGYTGSFPDVVTVVTDRDGDRSGWVYERGLPVTQTHGLDAQVPSTTSLLYDKAGRFVGIVDPNRSLWIGARNDAGDVIRTTDPLGRTTTATWDAHHNLTSRTSPMGIVTRITYDEHGLPVRVVDAEGTLDEAVLVISRDDAAHPADITRITDPLGGVTAYRYDLAGSVVGITDALGQVHVVGRDTTGRAVSTTDPTGAVVGLTRDSWGDLTAITDPLGAVTTLARDGVRRPTAVTNPLGEATTLTLDAAGRPKQVTLPDGTALRTGYDADGGLASQANGLGSTSSIARDEQGRPVSWQDALGDTWRIAWDPAGRLIRSADPTGVETMFTWDAAGQLIAIDHSDATPDARFTYDADGNRLTMTDGTGTTTYRRDALGRVVSVTDGAGRTVGTTYDARGFMTSITVPDGRTVEQDHDALGRLIAVRDGLGHESTFSWDAAGRPVGTVQGDGTVTERTYDARGGLVDVVATAAGASAPFLASTIERDALGRVAMVVESGATARATRDLQGRLTTFGDQVFTYDAAGNITSLRGAALTYDTADRLRSADGPAGRTSFSTDATGRRTAATPDSGTAIEYRWDAAGRLIHAAGTDNAYDGDGLRTSSERTDGTRDAFTWLRTGPEPILLGDGTSWYLYGPGGIPLEEIRADGEVRWLHADEVGNIRAVTDASGAVVSTAAWDAYGAPTGQTGEPPSRLGFQGQYTDPGTGLQFRLARFYDPATAAFLSIDPRVTETWAPYAYAAGDPLTFGDPAGTDPLPLPGGVAPGQEEFSGAEITGTAGYEGRYAGVPVEAPGQAGTGTVVIGIEHGALKTPADPGACVGLGGKLKLDVNVDVTSIDAGIHGATSAAVGASLSVIPAESLTP